MSEMVRINARVSKQMNEWIDNYSKETGVPKTTVVFLALETFIQQKEAFNKIDMLDKLMQDVELLKKAVSQER